MKRLILLFIFSGVMQLTYGLKRYDLTFIASPQVSWMTSDGKHIRNGSGFLGYGYGIEGDIFLHSDSYMIITGMTVSTDGGSLIYNRPMQINGTPVHVGTSVQYRMTNLEIPLALKMRTRNFNRLRYFAQFGVTNWINIKSSATSNNPTFQEVAARHQIRFFNIGLNIGAGMEYDLGKGNALTAGVIYSDGFSDLTKNPGIRENTSLNVMRLRLGFVF